MMTSNGASTLIETGIQVHSLRELYCSNPIIKVVELTLLPEYFTLISKQNKTKPAASEPKMMSQIKSTIPNYCDIHL